MVRTKQQRKRNRRKQDPADTIPPALANVVSVTASAGAAHVVFDSPIQIAPGVFPSSWKIATHPVSSAVQTGPLTATMMTGTTIIATDAYVFPAFDPAVRTPTGGWVAAKSGTVA